MSTTDQPASTYVAEYLDGPFAGTTEHRTLEGGEPEARVGQEALVEGTEGLFWYVAGDRKKVGETLFVQYRFDGADSDALEGDSDRDDESKSL